MKKVLLYSIMPEHMLNILNGNKTIEIRKRDLPQWAKEALKRGDVVEGYGYCTKGKPRLFKLDGIDDYNISNLPPFYGNTLNGLVVVKFEVSGSDVIHAHHLINQSTYWYTLGDNSDNTKLIEKSCVDMGVMLKYLGLNDGYAHHFTNIQPIEPMEIDRFISDSKSYNECPFAMSLAEEYMTSEEILINRGGKILTKAPQSFMTAWVKEVGE